MLKHEGYCLIKIRLVVSCNQGIELFGKIERNSGIKHFVSSNWAIHGAIQHLGGTASFPVGKKLSLTAGLLFQQAFDRSHF